jgi:hypothetical protein
MAIFSRKNRLEKPTIQLVNDVFNDHLSPSWQVRERIWMRNILYYIGEQYLDYVVSSSIFRRRLINPKTPTPVSNIIRDYVRSMRALILNKNYVAKVWPDSDELIDREAAKLAEHFLRDLEARNDQQLAEEKEKAATWITMAGTTFMRTIPELERGQMAIDKNGDMVPSGEVVSFHLIPYNVRVPDAGERLRDKTYVGVQSLKDIEWVEDTFHTKLKMSKTDATAVSYQKRLMSMVAQVSPWKGAGTMAAAIADHPDDEMCVFREVELRPTRDYPDGRYIVAVGDKIIKEFKKLPIPKDSDGRWHYSLTDFHYNYVPGSFWSDGGVNDQISPQNSINSIDQALEINRKGIGRPMVTVPTGLVIKRKNKGGQGFIFLEYDPRTSGGMAPAVHYGRPLPGQVFEERQTHRGVAQEAAGDPKNIMGGQAPSSQASGLMVDILRDAAEQQHTPDVERFYRSWMRVRKKELLVAQKLYTEKRLLKIGKGSQVQVKAFKGADLRGHSDVRMELASGLSSTKTGQNQVIIQMAEKGFFGDITQDPETQLELQRRLGLAGFKGKTSRDVDRAEYENGLIATIGADGIEMIPVEGPNGPVEGPDGNPLMLPAVPGLHMVRNETAEGPEGQPQTIQIPVAFDPLFQFDNHDIHFETHRRFLISPDFRELPEVVQMCALVHIETHRIEMMHQQAEQVQAQMITPGSDEDQKMEGENLDRSQAPGGQVAA